MPVTVLEPPPPPLLPPLPPLPAAMQWPVSESQTVPPAQMPVQSAIFEVEEGPQEKAPTARRGTTSRKRKVALLKNGGEPAYSNTHATYKPGAFLDHGRARR
jgi:hypothetical protein